MTDMATGEFQITVDAVVLKGGKILLMKRNTEPFAGEWALPGGRVGVGELLADAAKRETKEETGIDVEVVKQLGIYDALDRDPRRRSITVAYLCEAVGGKIRHDEEAQDVQWFELDEIPRMAFDHEKIVSDSLLQ